MLLILSFTIKLLALLNILKKFVALLNEKGKTAMNQ